MSTYQRFAYEASYEETSAKHKQAKAQYLSYLEAIRINEICYEKFVLNEKVWTAIAGCFFLLSNDTVKAYFCYRHMLF